MQFSSKGNYLSAISLYHVDGSAKSLLIQSQNYGDGTTGSEFDRAQLYFPVSYSLPNQPNFINSGGIHYSAGIDNGSSVGTFGRRYGVDGVPQGLARFDLIPTQLIVTTVPEPSEWAMMLVGFALVGYKVKRGKAQ